MVYLPTFRFTLKSTKCRVNVPYMDPVGMFNKRSNIHRSNVLLESLIAITSKKEITTPRKFLGKCMEMHSPRIRSFNTLKSASNC